MRIIKQQTVVRQLSDSIVRNEMSNVAMVLQTPTILTTYYSINSDLSEVSPGYNTVTDFIHPDSSVFYDRIENMPMCGIDNLVSTTEYDDDLAGFDENFSSSGVIYPRTIQPKPNDCFTINGDERSALYMITDMRRTTVRSNPFVEITFRLLSRNPDTIEQLNRQVREGKVVVMSPLSDNNSLVMTRKSAGDIERHVGAYLEMVALYSLLFYDRNKSAFVFDGLPSPDWRRRRCYVDMTLWRFMFDEGVVIFDDVVNYASGNGIRRMDRIYTGCPDVMVDDYEYFRSIIYRIYHREETPAVRRAEFDRYRFPRVREAPTEISKYQGLDIWYLEDYMDTPDPEDRYGDFRIWDDEFLCRIRTNDPYPISEDCLRSGACSGCTRRCNGVPVSCFNPYLRNAIIADFNDGEVDWENLQISDERTIENYYLIPLVLGLYGRHIRGLQQS